MKFQTYERPDGRCLGQPEVLVSHDTITELGFPLVDYDMLEEMSGYIKNNHNLRHPRITIHPLKDLYGFYREHSYTAHIDAILSEEGLFRTGGVMSTIGHELQHYSDYKNHPIATELEVKLEGAFHFGRVVATKMARLAVSSLHEAPDGYMTSSLEIRARYQEAYEEVEEFEQAILFPNSKRTSLLMHEGKLSADTKVALGIETAQKKSSILSLFSNKAK